MSVWDDLKKLFDGVIDRVEPPLPDNISTGDDVVDGLLRKLMRSGDVASQELAMNILGFQRYAQENRTMQLVQSTLDAEGISTTEIFDMEQDFNRGGIVHSAREIRAQQSFLPDGYNIDDIISRTQQAGAARGERIFNERVRAPLDRQIADVRMRSRPPANDEPHWDPETQRRGGETPDLSSGPPSSTPPANDNKIPEGAMKVVGRWLGRGLKTILPPAGIALAVYAVHEILNQRGELLDKLNSLQENDLIDRNDYDKMKDMIDGVAKLRALLEGVGNLPGVGLLTGVAVDTLGQREVDQQLEAIEEALASYRELRNDLAVETDALEGAINAGRAARESIEESLRDTTEGAQNGDLGIKVPDEAKDYIETDENGRLRLKEGVESPEAQRLINDINRQIDRLREGGSIDGFMNEIDETLRDAEGVRQEGVDTIRQLDQDIQQLEQYQQQLEQRNRQLNTLVSLTPNDQTIIATALTYTNDSTVEPQNNLPRANDTSIEIV